MKKIKVGIIGCGSITEKRHAPEYLDNPNVEIVAFYDLNKKRAELMVEKFGGKVADEYMDILNNPEIDAISDCTPNNMHYIISTKAMELGKHVLCEKPMTKSVEEAEKIAEVQDKELDGANIFGAHMEGPYFDIQYKGAQNEKYMKPAGIEEIKEYLSVKPGLVKLFSLSPKDDAALEAIKFLKENGVIVSIGHSAVYFDDVQKAIKAGLSHSTHTYNGMRGFTHREPGVVGAVLSSDSVMAEIIFDKIHVHPEAIRILLKAKGVDKVECITDAMSATGLPDGNYKLGELDVYVKDNQARLVSNDSLAGSVLTLDKAFKNIIELGYSIFDAVKMTSTNAAREFGLNTGEISEGKDADLVVLNNDYSVDMTFVKGKLKYQA